MRAPLTILIQVTFCCCASPTLGFQLLIGTPSRTTFPPNLSPLLLSPPPKVSFSNQSRRLVRPLLAEPIGTTPEEDKTFRDNIVDANRYAKALYFILGSTILLLPSLGLNTPFLPKKYAGAAGFYVASGLSHIMMGAAQHNRLSSDTYKRLNLGLCGFALCSLLAVPGEAGFFLSHLSTSPIPLIMAAFVKGFGALVAFQGWKDGSKEAKCYFQEFFEGAGKTIKNSYKSSFRGTGYRNVLLAVFIGMIATGKNLFDAIRLRPSNALQTSLFVSTLGRQFLISAILISLKDAGERDRLRGTTFVQLNWLLFTWTFLTGLGEGVYAFVSKSALPKLPMLPVSLVFLITSICFDLEKKGQLVWNVDKGRWTKNDTGRTT